VLLDVVVAVVVAVVVGGGGGAGVRHHCCLSVFLLDVGYVLCALKAMSDNR